jgi:tRNA(fMet)-specific endonuclease VapC
MATVLLDTDVSSFLLKGDSRASAYIQLIQGQRLALSFMTVAELFRWARVRKWGAARLSHLEQALAAYVILPTDIEMCRLWGQVRAERQSIGRPISPQDAWLRQRHYATIYRSSRIIPATSSRSPTSTCGRQRILDVVGMCCLRPASRRASPGTGGTDDRRVAGEPLRNAGGSNYETFPVYTDGCNDWNPPISE